MTTAREIAERIAGNYFSRRSQSRADVSLFAELSADVESALLAERRRAIEDNLAPLRNAYEALYQQLHELVERFNARRVRGDAGAFSDAEMLPARQALHTYHDLEPTIARSLASPRDETTDG